MSENTSGRTVLVTGATGFVGRHLVPALEAAGHDVRCGSRSPAKARETWPDQTWVEVDVEKPHTLEPALAGCSAAYFLVHAMSDDEGDYAERERSAALDFRSAAAAAGVERIVYLGGVAPAGEPSKHLASRLATGELLRQGEVPTAELRAAMIVGAGSASWRIVRDLAARLPAMVLPRWLRNRSRPVAIDDVVLALVAALDLPDGWSGWLDVPGPDTLSHRELLDKVAQRLGHRPVMLEVPVLTPRLSSYWVGLVSDESFGLARELVDGLASDLLPADDGVWPLLPEIEPTPLDEAIGLALADAESLESPSLAARERIAERAGRYAAGAGIRDPRNHPERRG